MGGCGFFLFSLLLWLWFSAVWGKKTKKHCVVSFSAKWVKTETREWKCFSSLVLTACHHLAVFVTPRPPAPTCSQSDFRHPTSDCLPLVGWRLNVTCILCSIGRRGVGGGGGGGVHFIVLFFFSLWKLGHTLVGARASGNVGHSCRVMSALRSWLLSGGTCCSAREQSPMAAGRDGRLRVVLKGLAPLPQSTIQPPPTAYGGLPLLLPPTGVGSLTDSSHSNIDSSNESRRMYLLPPLTTQPAVTARRVIVAGRRTMVAVQ